LKTEKLRVLATSDLHYSRHYAAAVEAFARDVVREAPDVLIIAGDVGEGTARFRACLDLFADLPASTVKMVLAGNHDVWTHDDEGFSSLELLEEELPQAARQAGFRWLETETPVIGGTGFAGSLAWYDYSGADPRVGASYDQILAHKRRVFVDAWRVDWPETDPQMSARLADGLEERIRRLEADPAVARIFVATHVPPWTGGLPRRPEYAVTAAFFVNLTLGDRLLRHARITHAVAGHIHRGASQRIERAGAPQLEFRIIASDYNRPAAVRFDLPGSSAAPPG
jgi:predicted phosphohydrolase